MVLRALDSGINCKLIQQHGGLSNVIKMETQSGLLLAKSKDADSDTDSDTYNEYICICGLELGSLLFFFFLIVTWEVVENAADNTQGKKQFAKFRMSQIKEVKHFYYIYTFVTLTFRVIIFSWSRKAAQARYTIYRLCMGKLTLSL